MKTRRLMPGASGCMTVLTAPRAPGRRSDDGSGQMQSIANIFSCSQAQPLFYYQSLLVWTLQKQMLRVWVSDKD